MATGGDNVQAIDTSLTAIIAAELTNIQTLQTQLTAANANPQPNYTISGPEGSQTVDWNGYTARLLAQLNDATDRLEKYMKQKQVNLPYFTYWRRGCR